MPSRRPPSHTPVPATGEVHWHIAHLLIGADLLGSVAPGATSAALNAAIAAALTQRQAGVQAAKPPHEPKPWMGAVAEALVARLPPTPFREPPR